MIAYQTNEDGVFVSTVECDPNPLEPNSFLVPRNAVTQEPPTPDEGQWARWDSEKWIIEEIAYPEPDFSEEEEEELTREIVELNRLAAYARYSDPLFFGWQRGENSEQDWTDAVASVKEMHPYPAV